MTIAITTYAVAGACFGLIAAGLIAAAVHALVARAVRELRRAWRLTAPDYDPRADVRPGGERRG